MHFMTLFLKFHWSGRKEELMNIQYRYEPSSRYSSGNVTEVYANDAPIGILESLSAASEQLSWNGYATQINKNLLEKAGFKNIPDQNPACMFLE